MQYISIEFEWVMSHKNEDLIRALEQNSSFDFNHCSEISNSDKYPDGWLYAFAACSEAPGDPNVEIANWVKAIEGLKPELRDLYLNCDFRIADLGYDAHEPKPWINQRLSLESLKALVDYDIQMATSIYR